MKRIIAMVLVLLALAGMVAGCGSAPTEEPTEAPAATNKDVTQEATAADEGEEIVITIWEAQWGNANYEDALKKLAEQATAAKIDGKNIRVEVQCIPWDNYYETFMTAYTTGTSPDIAWHASTAPSQYDDLGVAMDLTPIVEAWKAEGSGFYEETGEAAFNFYKNSEGEQIGIPVAIDGKGLLYNKAVFEKAGITELPTNYTELEAAFDKLLAIGVTPFACRANHCSLNNFLLFSNGGYNIGTDYSIHLGDDFAIEMYEMFQSWWDKGYIAEGCAGYSDDDAYKLLLNGDVGVVLGKAPTWAAAGEERNNIGSLGVPTGPSATEETKHNSMSFQAYYAYNTTKYPEETLAVMKWWIENNDLLYIEGGNSCIPLRQAQFDAVIGDDLAMNDFFNTYVNNNGVRTSFVYPFESFETWYGVFDGDKVNTKMVMSILTGEDYKVGLEQAIAETKEIFEAYGIEAAE